jgi:hypothetical protein
MKIEFSKASKVDYNISIEYYRNQGDELALRFKADIKQSINRIEMFPNLYPKIDDRVHKCVVSKFPYTIYYIIIDEIIYILAVANHYKDPQTFMKRF